MEEQDYYLLPKPAWEKLVSWYGINEGSQPIERSVHLLEDICIHMYTHVHCTYTCVCMFMHVCMCEKRRRKGDSK